MQDEEKQTRHSRKRTKWLVLKVGVLMLTLLVFGIGLAMWIVPTFVHAKIMRGLSKYWDGRVELAQIRISYFEPVSLRGLKLFDKAGRECIGAEAIEITLANWPGARPAVTGIRVDGLRVNVSAVDGKFSLPVVFPSSDKSKTGKKLALRKFVAEKAAITLDDGKGSKVAYSDISISVIRRADFYGVDVKGTGDEASHHFAAKGKIYPETLDTDISVQVRDDFNPVETAIASCLLKLPDWPGHGQLTADVRIGGRLAGVEALRPEGTITLTDWSILPGQGVPPAGFGTEVKFTGTGISLENTTVRDANGVEWLSAESSVLNLTGWPGTKPVLTGIDVSGLKVEASLVDRRLKVPMKFAKTDPNSAPEQQAKDNDRKFPKLTFQNAFVTVTDPNGMKMTFGNLAGEFVKDPNFYDITLAYRDASDANELNAKVIFRPATSDMELSLKSNMAIHAADMNTVLAMLKSPGLPAEGRLVTDLTIVGRPEKPETLQPKGLIRLKDWVKVSGDNAKSIRLSTDILFDGEKLRLENLAVRDVNGLELADAKKAQMKVENWPGLQPVLTEIAAEEFTVRPYTSDGTFCLPIKSSSDQSGPTKSKYIKLRKIQIRDAGVGIADNNDLRMAWDSLSIQPAEQDGFYDILLTSGRTDGTGSMRLEGSVNPSDSAISLSLEMDRITDKDETGVVFAVLGIPRASIGGKIRGDLTIEGNLKEPLKLQSKGSAKFDDCALFIEDGTLANKINTEVKIDGQKLGIEQFSAVVCDGKLTGSFSAEIKERREIDYQGQFLAVNVNFPQLTSVLTSNQQKAAAGKITADYRFTGRRDDVREIKGEGLVLFDDSDVSVVPVIPAIFRSLGLSQYEPLKMSDADAIFSTNGSVVTIKSGRIANRFAAIEFEPGGTVDLKAKTIDGYVVAAPLGQISGAIERLPIVNILANVKDKLTRLRIQGRWSDPPSSLIKKEPIKDIKDSTVGFVQDVVKSGGQLGQGMVNGFKGLLNKLGNNKDQ